MYLTRWRFFRLVLTGDDDWLFESFWWRGYIGCCSCRSVICCVHWWYQVINRLGHDDDANIVMIINAGAIPHYIRLIQTHDHDPEIQNQAIHGLWMMAYTGKDSIDPQLLDAIINGQSEWQSITSSANKLVFYLHVRWIVWHFIGW